jgi:hypothetical protein
MTNWREAHSWSRQNRKQTQFYTIVGERKSEKEILEEKAVAIRSQINQEIGMSMHRNEPMKTPSVIKHLLFYPLCSCRVLLMNHLIRNENNILERTGSLLNLSSQKHANCGNCLQKIFTN